MVLERAIGQMFKCTSVKVDGVCSSVSGPLWTVKPRILLSENRKKNLTQSHSYNSLSHPVTRSYFSPYFHAVRVQSNSGLGFFLISRIDQDVKAAHALRENYAPPMQSNFRVSAVLRFQRKVWVGCGLEGLEGGFTLPETNIDPEKRPSQKETGIPTIHFQVRTVSFREGRG